MEVSFIDPESFFRTRIDSLLTTAGWASELMNLLGLEGMSQVWSEKPAWYFWIKGSLGTYHLQLEGADSGDNARPVGSAKGLFSLRCYPYQDGALFQCFSETERRAIQSDLFDHTNTPAFDSLHRLPQGLFNVAAIEYTASSDQAWSLLTLESFNHLRTLRPARENSTSPGRVVRDVPAWDLAYPFFDRLLSLHAYSARQKPACILFATSPGAEYLEGENGSVNSIQTDRVKILTLMVLCASHEVGLSPRVKELIAREQQAGKMTVLYDFNSACRCHDGSHATVRNFPHQNSLWWSLSDSNFKSELDSMCGCEGQRHR